MKRTDSTKIKWQVQVRVNRNFKWRKKGLYETRDAAREAAMILRVHCPATHLEQGYFGYGRGNTRVVKYIRGEHHGKD